MNLKFLDFCVLAACSDRGVLLAPGRGSQISTGKYLADYVVRGTLRAQRKRGSRGQLEAVRALAQTRGAKHSPFRVLHEKWCEALCKGEENASSEKESEPQVELLIRSSLLRPGHPLLKNVSGYGMLASFLNVGVALDAQHPS